MNRPPTTRPTITTIVMRALMLVFGTYAIAIGATITADVAGSAISGPPTTQAAETDGDGTCADPLAGAEDFQDARTATIGFTIERLEDGTGLVEERLAITASVTTSTEDPIAVLREGCGGEPDLFREEPARFAEYSGAVSAQSSGRTIALQSSAVTREQAGDGAEVTFAQRWESSTLAARHDELLITVLPAAGMPTSIDVALLDGWVVTTASPTCVVASQSANEVSLALPSDACETDTPIGEVTIGLARAGTSAALGAPEAISPTHWLDLSGAGEAFWDLAIWAVFFAWLWLDRNRGPRAAKRQIKSDRAEAAADTARRTAKARRADADRAVSAEAQATTEEHAARSRAAGRAASAAAATAEAETATTAAKAAAAAAEAAEAKAAKAEAAAKAAAKTAARAAKDRDRSGLVGRAVPPPWLRMGSLVGALAVLTALHYSTAFSAWLVDDDRTIWVPACGMDGCGMVELAPFIDGAMPLTAVVVVVAWIWSLLVPGARSEIDPTGNRRRGWAILGVVGLVVVAILVVGSESQLGWGDKAAFIDAIGVTILIGAGAVLIARAFGAACIAGAAAVGASVGLCFAVIESHHDIRGLDVTGHFLVLTVIVAGLGALTARTVDHLTVDKREGRRRIATILEARAADEQHDPDDSRRRVTDARIDACDAQDARDALLRRWLVTAVAVTAIAIIGPRVVRESEAVAASDASALAGLFLDPIRIALGALLIVGLARSRRIMPDSWTRRALFFIGLLLLFRAGTFVGLPVAMFAGGALLSMTLLEEPRKLVERSQLARYWRPPQDAVIHSRVREFVRSVGVLRIEGDHGNALRKKAASADISTRTLRATVRDVAESQYEPTSTNPEPLRWGGTPASPMRRGAVGAAIGTIVGLPFAFESVGEILDLADNGTGPSVFTATLHAMIGLRFPLYGLAFGLLMPALRRERGITRAAGVAAVVALSEAITILVPFTSWGTDIVAALTLRTLQIVAVFLAIGFAFDIRALRSAGLHLDRIGDIYGVNRFVVWIWGVVATASAAAATTLLASGAGALLELLTQRGG
ncbi:hypothetical protein [Demequina rhizosphaerae]|uniref:hypothetical protein n=1 Tax=Demequina rhizosphaerae TaxID=1638985 RepID=UPI00078489B5|nr:hypothetical protein [Demequina rhizosphaerae]